MRIWERVAARYLEAVSNPEVAKAIAGLIKGYLISKLQLNVGYDATKEGVQKQSEDGFSFLVRPSDFDKENLNGTVQVRVTYDSPITETGPALANKPVNGAVEVGYYYKTPRLPGGGKYMFPKGAGSIDIKFDKNGIPSLADPNQLNSIVDAIQDVTTQVVTEPPPGAKSLTRDPKEREREKELADKAREFQREKEQGEKAEAIRTQESETHGSIDSFVQYMADSDESSFGPGDLQKVLNTMYKSPNDRAFQRNNVITEIRDKGLKWDPYKKMVAAELSPDDLVQALNEIADAIMTRSIDRTTVASSIKSILAQLG